MQPTSPTAMANAIRALTSTPRVRQAPHPIDFKIRPISEEWRYQGKAPSFQSAVCNVAYIWRDDPQPDRFGSTPAKFAERRFELRDGGLLLPGGAPVWATEGYRIWEDADAATAATGDPTDISAWHMIAAIPEYIPGKYWSWLVRGFLQQELADKGAAVAWATHGLEDDAGGYVIPGHFHAIITARHWRTGPRKGQRHPAWAASRAHQIRLAARWRRRCATTRLIALNNWAGLLR